MKPTLTAALLASLLTVSGPARAAEEGTGFALGAGQWTCAKALEVNESGTDIDIGLLVGWVFGFWSSATFTREDAFDAQVEKAGGQAIFDLTMAQCREVPDMQLHFLSQAMIANTK